MDTNLSFKNISKIFPGVIALDDISLDIKKSEVHALIGENGAGKSTLVKILGGVYPPEKGTISIRGKEEIFSSAKEAIKKGIRIVYQELQLISELTVTENLMLGDFFTKNFIIKNSEMESYIQKILDEYNIPVKASSTVGHLSIGEKQLVEISKCLVRDPNIIALDEPTSSLSNKEIDILFSIINKLKNQGKTILYISHRFNEIFNICTSASVLRDGKLVKQYDKLKDVSSDEIISQMVGRKIETNISYKSRELGHTIFEVNNISSYLLQPMSFYLREKEIVGFFGLVGSGRSELMRLLIGADKKTSGEIIYNNKKINIKNPKDSIKHGIAYLTEDRKKEGIINETDIVDNTLINSRSFFSKFAFFIDPKKENDITQYYIDKLKTKVSSKTDKITQLSGGNQQKVIISRFLSNKNIKILILDEPTRGIDVGAKQEIYKLITELANSGYSIIMISSELPEIINLSDRAYVLYQKKNITEIERNKIDETTLLNKAFFGK